MSNTHLAFDLFCFQLLFYLKVEVCLNTFFGSSLKNKKLIYIEQNYGNVWYKFEKNISGNIGMGIKVLRVWYKF